jgi:hypothetical protein
MNASKSIIMVGALFAIAAPAANATLDRTLPTKTSRAKVTKAVVHKRIEPAIIVAKTHKPVARIVDTQPLYIYSAGPTVPAGTDTAAATVADDCGDDPAIVESQNPAD